MKIIDRFRALFKSEPFYENPRMMEFFKTTKVDAEIDFEKVEKVVFLGEVEYLDETFEILAQALLSKEFLEKFQLFEANVNANSLAFYETKVEDLIIILVLVDPVELFENQYLLNKYEIDYSIASEMTAKNEVIYNKTV